MEHQEPRHPVTPKTNDGMYRHHTGRESHVQIVEERRIGAGEVGEAFEVKALVQGRECTFVLKKFFHGEELNNREIARKVFENYTQAKAAGLKVFPTFRLNEEAGTILMTIGYNEDWHCISANNRGSKSLKDFGAEKLSEIPHFQEFVRNVLEESRKAAAAGIFLPADSFFFIIRKDRQDIDFYLGDVDSVRKVKLEKDQNLAQLNLTQVDSALSLFIEANVADEDLAFKYTGEVNKQIQAMRG
jgi:hypothetical protein